MKIILRYLKKNILDLIIIFNVIPIFFLIGIPHPKLFLIFFIFPFLLFRNFKEIILFKRDKFQSLIVFFIAYQIFILIYAFFVYDLDYFDNGKRFYETIFVISIYSLSPAIVVFFVKQFDLRKLDQTKYLLSIIYSALGLFILFSIVYKFKFEGIQFDFSTARDILLVGINGEFVNKPEGIPEGRFSLSTIYIYFGKSNTLAPVLSLVVLNLLPYLTKLSARFINKKNVIFSLILLIDLFLIFLLRSRASLIAVLIPFIGFELLYFIKIKKLLSKHSRRSFLFILTFIAFLTFALNSNRYSFNAYLNDPRFDILVGLFSNVKNISLLGKGIGSGHFLCQTLGMSYIDLYKTTECTFHNYYLTLLHDFGIIGFIIFILILFTYINNVAKAIKIFFKSKEIKTIQISSFPNKILSSIYFILGSSILLFFDSDIMTSQPIFSILYWSLFAINFYSIEKYINEFQKENYL